MLMHVICPKCHATNRVEPEKITKASPICGNCKATLVLEARGFPEEAGDGNFEAQVLKSNLPVLVDFWSPTCPPCKRLEPILKSLAKELAGKVKVVKVNVEENRRIPYTYSIQAVPTIVLFQGKEVARTTGYQSMEELLDFACQTTG